MYCNNNEASTNHYVVDKKKKNVDCGAHIIKKMQMPAYSASHLFLKASTTTTTATTFHYLFDNVKYLHITYIYSSSMD